MRIFEETQRHISIVVTDYGAFTQTDREGVYLETSVGRYTPAGRTRAFLSVRDLRDLAHLVERALAKADEWKTARDAELRARRRVAKKSKRKIRRG